MEENKIDLVIHPVRLRILRCLSSGPQSTQEIAEHLPDVPTSSLYRHLSLLLKGDWIVVADTRMVQGIQEKVYRLVKSPRLSAADLADAGTEDHLRYFTTYVITLLQDFSNYLESSAKIDFLADRAGYSEVEFWASDGEVDELSQALNMVILPILSRPRTESSRKRKLATVVHPIDQNSNRQD